MKYTYLFLLLISIIKTASGQDEKPVTAGHFLVGGSVSYYSQTSKQTNYLEPPGQHLLFTTKEDVFQLNVILGYYLINHLALSLLADANTYTEKETINSTPPTVLRNRYSTFGLGPLVRYSTGSGLFIQGSASFGFNKTYYSGENKFKSQSYSLGVGYSFFIKGLLSIEPSLSYKYTRVAKHGIEGEIKRGGIFFALGTYMYFDLVKRK
jgi:hypothetical protein